jgi:DNA/RNA endonuclease G (NUC1)
VDEEVHDSFSLTNVSPQRPSFNRSIWLRLEEFVRQVAEHEEHKEDKAEQTQDGSSRVETWVITGPLWLPTSTSGKEHFRYTYEGIGQPPSLIHVPTHFFKVVIVVSEVRKKKNTHTIESSKVKNEEGGPQYELKKFAAFVIPHSESAGNPNPYPYPLP